MASILKRKKKKYHPPFDDENDEYKSRGNVVSTSMNELVHMRIFKRAIASAQKHQIKLEPGRENHGHGNCSYESVIYNINERSCFTEKLPMSPNYYRRIWNLDMMNKIIDKTNPWNPGLTKLQLTQGFTELMESGVYERPFFGDMMMAGIACGIKKRILIFNTNEGIIETGHDPISVIDPVHYGGIIEDEVPVIVAYDLVHYESLHPVERQDIEETIKLTKSYIATPSRYGQEYGFSRNDIADLISENIIKNTEPVTLTQDIKLTESSLKTQTKLRQATTRCTNIDTEGFKFGELCFEELNAGKIKCGVCQTECTRLMSHLSRSLKCNQYLNLEIFKTEYTKYKARNRKRKQDAKQKAENIQCFREKANKRKSKQEAKEKAEDFQKFKEDAHKRKKKHENKKKADDLEKYRENANKRLKNHETKKKTVQRECQCEA